ncbi:hypothetical protein CFB35_30565 [Burkholderia sp. AU16482]|nr:hypothetical protein CFB35_30565 [Burkholderia sp. AU16482]
MRGGGLDTEPGHGVGVGRHRPGGSSFRHACLLYVMAAGEPGRDGDTSIVDSRYIAINDKRNLES